MIIHSLRQSLPEPPNSTIYDRRYAAHHNHPAGSFPNTAHRIHGADLCPLPLAGMNMGRMTNRFLANYALPLKPKLPNEPKGAPSRRARGGRMTHRFFAHDGPPLKLRNEPKAGHPRVPKAAG
jgi:hypothetical protein